MTNMVLGSYSFDLDPARVTGLDHGGLVREKPTARAETLTSSVLFVWPPVTAGAEIVLEWERMDAAMWEQLQAMAESSEAYAFDPQIGGATFEVVVTGLTAAGRDPNGMSRVRMTINVRS
jgi:hypothetical protein